VRLKRVALLIAGLLAAPIAANASTVTFDFTGTVTSATGIYSSVAVGTSISGTYVINIANANASGSILPVVTSPTTQASWQLGEVTGSSFGTPPSPAYVFSSTANVAGFSYSTSAVPGTDLSDTKVSGAVNPTIDSDFSAGEGNVFTSGSQSSSNLDLEARPGDPVPWTSAGLPNFSLADSFAGGTFAMGFSNQVNFNITSMTPVPLPGSAWLMLSGLLCFGSLTVKRRGFTQPGTL
jgi:hypothetical protein